ncbi:von willebrand factor a domain-containing protein 5a [Anaeramoeba ignava]|uniref:von willebrand factor a domain-containing protein 5a n=1 Tax=Anaeramoeba ignava TaxID=1746090 RepID=A0A9Q0LEH4_ANAIG|nr:von willebrand factor a domain-containing protein 5a [Anaeramoeba ignava]
MSRIGLFNKSNNSQIPLKKVKFQTNIIDFAAKVSVDQVFENEEKFPIETVFVFPLNSNSAIFGFEILINNEKIIGKVKEKEKAQQIYNDSISKGKTAFKLDQETPDIFVTNVGNLAPKQSCTITILYVTTLYENEKNQYGLFLPTSITKCYVPLSDQERAQNLNSQTLQYSTDIGVDIEFSFRIKMSSRIVSITSITHSLPNQINIEKNESNFLFSPQKKEIGKDFLISIQEETPHAPRVISEVDETEEIVSMITMYPQLPKDKLNTELIFLVDRSGSMSGKSIDYVKSTLEQFLQIIPKSSYFNIVGFGSSFVYLFPKSRKYSSESIKEAGDHVSQMSANLGGTELKEPLKSIFENEPPVGFSRQIFLLTDGAVSNTEEIISLVKSESKTTRIFTFGIGHGASKELIENIAKITNANFEMILDHSSIQSQVMKQFERSLQPSITNLNISWEGVSAKHITPYYLPPIFSNQRYLFFAFISNQKEKVEKATVIISGQILDEKVEWKLDFNPQNLQRDSTLHKLAAKSMIKDLEQKSSSFHTKMGKLKKGLRKEAVEQEILRLSLKNQIVSSQTSFVSYVQDPLNLNHFQEMKFVPIEIQSPTQSSPKKNTRKSSFNNFSCFAQRVTRSEFSQKEDFQEDQKNFHKMEKEVHQVLHEIYQEMGKDSPVEIYKRMNEREEQKDVEITEVFKQKILEKHLESLEKIKNENFQIPKIVLNVGSFDIISSSQTQEGNWEISQELCSAVGISQEVIENSNPFISFSLKTWFNILIISLIQVCFPKFIQISKKAEEWLKKEEIQNIDLIIEETKRRIFIRDF